MPEPISLLDQLPASPEPAPAPDEGGGIPDAVLQLPEFSAILRGSPPAVWADKADESPEVKIIVDNHKDLMNAGFGFYGGKDGQTVVLFNTQFTSPEEVKKMDAAGKLREFATPFDELKAHFAQGDSGQPASPAPGGPAPVAPVAPPASVGKKLATQRIKNLTPGGPTSGPTPGQGRILNSLGTPAV